MSEHTHEQDLEAWPIGAHLVSPRRGYTHHGIYVGAGRVVHYAGLHLPRGRGYAAGARVANALRYGPVEETTVEEFAQGFAVAWVLEPGARFCGETVVARARSRLGESRYKLLTNNCEHFTTWCIHGVHRSAQVERLLRSRATRRNRDLAIAPTSSAQPIRYARVAVS